MVLPKRASAALALVAALALTGCPSSVRVETPRTTGDAVEAVDAPEAFDAPVDLPPPSDADGWGDVRPEVAVPCDTDDDCQGLAGLDACTTPRCRSGNCATIPVPGCCLADADCVPADPTCHEGRCPRPGGGCVFVDTCAPCDADADCADPDPCTRGSCHEGLCRYDERPGCCLADADCADADPCTTDACEQGTCGWAPVPGCCLADADCVPPDGLRCREGVCLDHACAWRPVPGCCVSDAACDDGDPCTADACDGGTCVHALLPTCGGCTDALQCDDGDPCTTDACDLGSGVCRHEDDPACGGCTDALQCDDGDPCTADFCQGGTCVYVVVPCGCATDAHCDDHDACTVDHCADGVCLHEPLPGCACHADTDCHDQNACTKDRCLAGQCVHDAVPDCCQEPLDCSDGNPCTWDVCTDNACYSYPAAEAPGCCATAADCPAPGPCEVAVCRPDSHCDVTVAPDCCPDTVALATGFDGTDGTDWELSGQAKPVHWGLDGHRVTSAPLALYFGNPNTHTYALPGQASAGTATSPFVVLPTGVGARLRFALWLDVEFQPDVDRLEVRVLDGASTTVAWSKAALAQAAYRSWTGVEVDLAPWIGRTVRLQLAFDSVDALDNGGEGVVIDDVDVRAPCAP